MFIKSCFGCCYWIRFYDDVVGAHEYVTLVHTVSSEAIGGNDNIFELLTADESISVGVVEVKDPAQLVCQ